MREYFAEIDIYSPEFGELYDELPLWSAPFGLMLLEEVALPRSGTILDVGAGTGFMTVELAQRCGAGAHVIAVDPWKAAFDRLRRKVEYLGLGNVTLIERDAALLDLPDRSVDLVVSNLGVNNFENVEAVLRTCFRVMRPGARMTLTTNLVGHMAEFYDVFRATLAGPERAEERAALEAHVAHRATIPSLTRLLTGAGLEMVHVTTNAFRLRYADGSALLRHNVIRFGFLPAWKGVVAPHRIEPTFEALEQGLNALAAQTGELALTIPAACVTARRPAP